MTTIESILATKPDDGTGYTRYPDCPRCAGTGRVTAYTPWAKRENQCPICKARFAGDPPAFICHPRPKYLRERALRFDKATGGYRVVEKHLGALQGRAVDMCDLILYLTHVNRPVGALAEQYSPLVFPVNTEPAARRTIPYAHNPDAARSYAEQRR